MSAAKHTPGPWEHRQRKTRGGQTVHEIHQAGRNGATWRIATLEFPNDARLIAAAPELLEALLAFVALERTGDDAERAAQLATAAIAKTVQQ